MHVGFLPSYREAEILKVKDPLSFQMSRQNQLFGGPAHEPRAANIHGFWGLRLTWWAGEGIDEPMLCAYRRYHIASTSSTPHATTSRDM